MGTAIPAPKRRIVILGGGAAGWITANMMARRWRDSPVDITVIESSDVGIIGVGEGTTPQLKAFFDYLDLAEADWMPACNATYKNGISFKGWSEREGCERYFHPFPSPIDAHTSPAFFYNAFMRRRGVDLCAQPDRFFIPAYLAKHRLAPLPSENFPFQISYAYHFDAHLLGAFLRDHAKSRGVHHEDVKIVAVAHKENGDVFHLEAEDGRTFEADFFVDCSGFRSLILQQSLNVPFKSFAENLFNDAAVVLPTPADPDGLNAQTISTALKYGWAWDIPLTNRTGNGYVYSSQFCSADEAEQELRDHLGLGDSDVAARHLKMKVGQVEKHWSRNCLAVGLSQGFIEPLEATALHLVLVTVETFMANYEQGGFTNQKEDAFNADINARFEGIRDYIVCHYRANRRRDTDYWIENAENNALSDSLKRLLQCWTQGGDIGREIADQNINKYYSSLSWHCLLAGYGTFPDDAALKPPDAATKRYELNVVDEFVRRCALNFRDHREVLQEMR